MVLDSDCGASTLNNDHISINDDSDTLQPASKSRVESVSEAPSETHLLSELVSREVMQRYELAEEKMKRELAAVSLDDNIWYLRS